MKGLRNMRKLIENMYLLSEYIFVYDIVSCFDTQVTLSLRNRKNSIEKAYWNKSKRDWLFQNNISMNILNFWRNRYLQYRNISFFIGAQWPKMILEKKGIQTVFLSIHFIWSVKKWRLYYFGLGFRQRVELVNCQELIKIFPSHMPAGTILFIQ